MASDRGNPFTSRHTFAGQDFPALGARAKKSLATISQAAKEEKVTRMTISRWIASGQIKVKQHGRYVLILRTSLTRKKK